jgi:esterase
MQKQQQKIFLPTGIALNITEWATNICDAKKLPVVLLIHGTGDAACVWTDIVGNLVGSYRVLGIDLRGHGDSDWASDGDYRTEAMADDLVSLVELLALDQLTLIGHSLGAAVALHFASRHAARLACLVLVDYGPEVQNASVTHIRNVVLSAHHPYCTVNDYQAVLQDRHPLAMPQLLDEIAKGTTRRVANGEVVLKYDPAIMAARNTTERAPDAATLWKILQNLYCPVLVMRGMASSVLSQQIAEKMAYKILPQGSLAIVPIAGHSIQIDNPSAFNLSLGAFLHQALKP